MSDREGPLPGDTHQTLYALREAERFLVPDHLDLPDHVLLLAEAERDAAIEAVQAGEAPAQDLRALVRDRKPDAPPSGAEVAEDGGDAAAGGAAKTIGPPPGPADAPPPAPLPAAKTIGPGAGEATGAPDDSDAPELERSWALWLGVAVGVGVVAAVVVAALAMA